MSALGHFIHQYGVLGVALGAGAEGETAVVIGGVLAGRGLFDPVAAAIAAAFGSFIADQLFFFLGRSQRNGRFVARVREKPVFARAIGFIERHPLLFCFAFRYVYGFRVAGPVAIGVSAVPARVFVFLNFISAVSWGAIFTWLGYRFGRQFEHALRALLTPEHLALALLAAGLVAAGVWGWRRRTVRL